MDSFLAYLNKEIMEGVRNRKFLILAIGILFFGLLDPVITKITPMIVASQTDMDISQFIELSQRASLQKHLMNLFQIYPIIIVFTLMGLISGEINSKTFVIPISLGARFKGIVKGKFLVYTLFLIGISIVDILVTYYYSGIIFGFEFLDIFIFVKIGILVGVFFSFVVSLLIFFGSLFRKNSVAAMITIGLVFVLPLISTLYKPALIYSPYNLIVEARYLIGNLSKELAISFVWTFFYIFLLSSLSIRNLERKNLM